MAYDPPLRLLTALLLTFERCSVSTSLCALLLIAANGVRIRSISVSHLVRYNFFSLTQVRVLTSILSLHNVGSYFPAS